MMLNYTTNNPYIQDYIDRHGLEKWIRKRYNLYYNFMRRVFSSKERIHYPTYKDCHVSPEWAGNREAFNEWLEIAYYEVSGCEDAMELDKDVLSDKRTYGPQYCIFVPHEVNSAYTSISSNLTPKYCKQKMDRIHSLAEKYKDQIPRKLYNALKRFTLDPVETTLGNTQV